MKKLIIIFILTLSKTWGMRIISTSPAITEIMLDLKQEHRLVGISNYCILPKRIEGIAKIGTALTPDYEKIYKLKADYVFMNETKSTTVMNNLKKLKIKYLGLKFYTLKDILESYQKITQKLGLKKKYSLFREKVEKSLSQMPQLIAPESFIIIIGMDRVKEKMKSIHIAGTKTHFNDILSPSGFHNAALGKVPYPIWDRELLLKKNPDRIFFIFSDFNKEDQIQKDLKAIKKMKSLKAVKNNQIKVIKGNFTITPGPQIIQLINEFAKVTQ